MKAPYKYPYISIFILSYYFLEHEGYYYKLRSYFGYSVDDKINYVISIKDDNLQNIIQAPGRKAIVYYSGSSRASQTELPKTAGNASSEDSQSEIFKKLARSYKEKLRSPLLFAEKPCTPNEELCSKYTTPFLAYYFEGKFKSVWTGEFTKKKVKKSIREFNKS